jgi:hypothetical protein
VGGDPVSSSLRLIIMDLFNYDNLKFTLLISASSRISAVGSLQR